MGRSNSGRKPRVGVRSCTPLPSPFPLTVNVVLDIRGTIASGELGAILQYELKGILFFGGVPQSAMLEFLENPTLLAQHFPRWLCLDHAGTSSLTFHGERPMIIGNDRYTYGERNNHCRAGRKVPNHWHPNGKYHQVLPRRQGRAYAINTSFQVVRLEGSRRAPEEYPLTEIGYAQWLGQYKDGLYVLNAKGDLNHWRYCEPLARWQFVTTERSEVRDFAVSWEGKLLISAKRNGVFWAQYKYFYRPVPSDSWLELQTELILHIPLSFWFQPRPTEWSWASTSLYPSMMMNFSVPPLGMSKTLSTINIADSMISQVQQLVAGTQHVVYRDTDSMIFSLRENP